MKHEQKKLSFIVSILAVLSFGFFMWIPDSSLSAQDDPPAQIENGDFETGDLTGWEITSGDAFCEAAVTDDSTFFSDPERPFNQQGTYHYRADKCGGDDLTGTMKSSDFTLSGSGYISLLLGNGQDPDEVYVNVKKASDDTTVATIANDKFVDVEYSNNYQRYFVDVSSHVGEELYIELVDNDKDGWGMLNVDDVITYYEDTPTLDVTTPDTLSYYQDDPEPDWDQFIEDHSEINPHYRDPDYDDLTYTVDSSDVDLTTEGTYTLTYTFTYFQGDNQADYVEVRDIPVEVKPVDNQIINGGFETGDYTGWYTSGDAFCHNGITSDATFWEEAHNFNHQGDYHFHGAHCGEPSTGTLTSSSFMLEGSGYISMLLGAGPDKDDVHVNVVDYDTDEVVTTIDNSKFHDSPDDETSEDYNNNYVRYYEDLSEHLGTRLYLEVVDNDEEDWAFINIDDVVTYYEDTPELDVSHSFPEAVELDEEKPDFDALISHAPTYPGATITVNESVDTSVRDTYTIEYTLDYDGLSTTKTEPFEVHRELIDVSVTTSFDASNNDIENTIDDLEYGTKVTFDDALAENDDYEFAFWVVDGNVRKDLPIDHSFTINDSISLDAIFSPSSDHADGLHHAAVFMDSNEALIDVQHIPDNGDASDVTENLPSKPGYEIASTKWDQSLSDLTSDTVYVLQYEKASTDTFTLTVDNGSGGGTYDYNSVVTVTPDEEDFSYWTVDGEVVSHQSEYRFTLLNDTTIEAVYDDGSEADSPFLSMNDNPDLPDRDNHYSFLSQFHLPDDHSLIEFGIIASDEDTTIELDTEGITRYKGTKYNGDTDEFLLSIPKASTTTARAYLTYEVDGTIHTIYSDQS